MSSFLPRWFLVEPRPDTEAGNEDTTAVGTHHLWGEKDLGWGIAAGWWSLETVVTDGSGCGKKLPWVAGAPLS